MATTTYKILGQVAPAMYTATDLYTVPAATQTVVSTITVCNQGSSNSSYSISIRKAGATDTPKQYIVYSAYIAAHATDTLTLGITLGATDVITVYLDGTIGVTTISFNAFGSETA